MYEQKNESGACNGGWFLICSIAPFMTARESDDSLFEGLQYAVPVVSQSGNHFLRAGNAVLSGKVHRLRYVR